jgi:hypothetical protein
MFEMYGDVTFGDVSKLRQKHRVHAIADLQSSNRHSIFTDMTDRTKCMSLGTFFTFAYSNFLCLVSLPTRSGEDI